MLRRTFTVEEANAALPQVRRLIERVVEGSQRLPELQDEFRIRTYRARRPAGTATDREAATLAAADLRRAEEDLAEALGELGRSGVEVKDLLMGVVDFPSVRDGRVVELCWRVGEPAVGHWHPAGGGYGSRQPLP